MTFNGPIPAAGRFAADGDAKLSFYCNHTPPMSGINRGKYLWVFKEGVGTDYLSARYNALKEYHKFNYELFIDIDQI